MEVQPDDIPELLLESRVAGKLEGLYPVGLHVVGPPDAVDAVG